MSRSAIQDKLKRLRAESGAGAPTAGAGSPPPHAGTGAAHDKEGTVPGKDSAAGPSQAGGEPPPPRTAEERHPSTAATPPRGITARVAIGLEVEAVHLPLSPSPPIAKSSVIATDTDNSSPSPPWPGENDDKSPPRGDSSGSLLAAGDASLDTSADASLDAPADTGPEIPLGATLSRDARVAALREALQRHDLRRAQELLKTPPPVGAAPTARPGTFDTWRGSRKDRPSVPPTTLPPPAFPAGPPSSPPTRRSVSTSPELGDDWGLLTPPERRPSSPSGPPTVAFPERRPSSPPAIDPPLGGLAGTGGTASLGGATPPGAASGLVRVIATPWGEAGDIMEMPPLPGEWLGDHPLGPIWRVMRRHAPHETFGNTPLGDLFQVSPAQVLPLFFREEFTDGSRPLPHSWSDLAFVDTETNGLAGGTGTIPFLIGVGTFDEDGTFQVWQGLMRTPAEESRVLRHFENVLSRRNFVVSYNGDGFDLPLLRTRFVLHGRPDPFDLRHPLDLLGPARRLYRLSTTNRKLKTLEREVLGFERVGDVEGAAIPAIYRWFARTGRHPHMPAVIEHNRLDVLSMPVLLYAMAKSAIQAGLHLPHRERLTPPPWELESREGASGAASTLDIPVLPPSPLLPPPSFTTPPNDAEALPPAEAAAIAQSCLKNGQVDRAFALFTRALAGLREAAALGTSRPTDAAVWVVVRRGLRDVEMRRGRFQDARIHAEALLDLLPGSADDRKAAAQVAEQCHDMAAALAHVEAALRLPRLDDERRASLEGRRRRLAKRLDKLNTAEADGQTANRSAATPLSTE